MIDIQHSSNASSLESRIGKQYSIEFQYHGLCLCGDEGPAASQILISFAEQVSVDSGNCSHNIKFHIWTVNISKMSLGVFIKDPLLGIHTHVWGVKRVIHPMYSSPFQNVNNGYFFERATVTHLVLWWQWNGPSLGSYRCCLSGKIEFRWVLVLRWPSGPSPDNSLSRAGSFPFYTASFFRRERPEQG